MLLLLLSLLGCCGFVVVLFVMMTANTGKLKCYFDVEKLSGNGIALSCKVLCGIRIYIGKTTSSITHVDLCLHK